MPRRVLGGLLAVLLTVATAACGDDDNGGPTGPTIGAEAVAGVYDPTALTFDVQGQLAEMNILERLDQTIPPRLVIDLEGGFQLAFIDPASKKIQLSEGRYTLLEDGVRLTFESARDAEYLLLPRELDLVHSAEAGTLSFSGSLAVSRSRLRELVPEFQDEPLSDPVPGDLTIEFTRDEESSGSEG